MRKNKKSAYICHRDGWVDTNWPVVFYKKGGPSFSFNTIGKLALFILKETGGKYTLRGRKIPLGNFIKKSNLKDYRKLTSEEWNKLDVQLERLERIIKQNK